MKRFAAIIGLCLLLGPASGTFAQVPTNAYQPNGLLYGGNNCTITPVTGTSAYSITCAGGGVSPPAGDIGGTTASPTVNGIEGAALPAGPLASKVLTTTAGGAWQWTGAPWTDPSSAIGDLYLGQAGTVAPTALPDVATGSPLSSGGVGANPSWGHWRTLATMAGGSQTISISNGVHTFFVLAAAQGGATEINQVTLPPLTFTIKNLSCFVQSAPGASNSYAVSLDSCNTSGASCAAASGSPSNIGCTISTAALSCTDTANTNTLTSANTYDWNVLTTVGGSAPSATGIRCQFELDI